MTKNLYTNDKWYEFSEKVKRRDDYTCLQCGRSAPEVVIQVHHEIYIPNKPPWEYALSDCRTLCKGCHARNHRLIEPNTGWTLLLIDDLGGLYGICERENCGTEIRYEHLTYHPNWGYKVVGSTCIEYLTQEDRLISSHVVKVYKNISDYINNSVWHKGTTKKGKQYISSSYNHHLIRIYGDDKNYSFQIGIKIKWVRKHTYRKIINAYGRNLSEVKELAYITLKGTLSDDDEETEFLRHLYRKITR
jgi:hypothetical protein